MFSLQSLKKLWPYPAALVLFILTATYITFPLILHLGDYATNLRDELLISWIQVSVIHNLMHNPYDIFRGNIFYPYNDTLAYSDLHLTSALFSAIPFWVTGQPITTLNFTVLFSLFLLGFAAFTLVFTLTRSIYAGILAGILVQFSPVTLDKNVHVQVLAIGWVLFAILFYLKWLQTRLFRYFVIALCFFVVQTLNSFLPGYFIIFSWVIMTIVVVRARKKNILYFFQRKHLLAIAAAIFLLLPFIYPYVQVSREFSFRRDIREAVHLSLQPEDLLYPNDLTRLQPLLEWVSRPSMYPKNSEFKVGYIGFVFSLLVLLTIWYCIKKRKKISVELLSFVLIGSVGLLLSLGPVLHFDRKTVHIPFVVPLPYALLYYIVPGFQGIRAAYRWEMLFVLSMSVSSAFVVWTLTKRLFPYQRSFIYLALIFLVIAEYNPMRFMKVPQVHSFPKVYSYIAKQNPDATIVEMPIYNWNMAPYSTQELVRVYYSSIHQLRTLNGASGFSPPPWQKLVTDVLHTFPSKESVSKLRSLGIKYIIVHQNEYDILQKNGFVVSGVKMRGGDSILDQLRSREEVNELSHFGDDFVFEIQ